MAEKDSCQPATDDVTFAIEHVANKNPHRSRFVFKRDGAGFDRRNPR